MDKYQNSPMKIILTKIWKTVKHIENLFLRFYIADKNISPTHCIPYNDSIFQTRHSIEQMTVITNIWFKIFADDALSPKTQKYFPSPEKHFCHCFSVKRSFKT